MEQLTGVKLADWSVLGLLALGVLLILRSWWRQDVGPRLSGVLVIPLVAGLVVVAVVWLALADNLIRVVRQILTTPLAAVVATAVVLVTFAVVDLIFIRVVPLTARILRFARVRDASRTGVAAIGVLSIVVLLSLAVVGQLSRHSPGTVPSPPAQATPTVPPAGDTPTEPPTDETPTNPTVERVQRIELPGSPMDLAMHGDREGYVSLAEGSIVRFTLGQSEISLETVADGLENLRGIAITGGRLFVVELGPLPCDPPVPLCKGNRISPDDPQEGEATFIAETRGRVRAFDIGPDGALSGGEAVLSDLPVVGADHADNGMTVGPDGYVYLSIGNVDTLWRSPERLPSLTPNAHWLGTVLRFDGSGAPPEIFARGLRNVYDLTFDDAGRLWGVDNDGPAQDGWRQEEILHIKQGGNYGFPYEATFGPKSIRSDQPIWLSPHVGSAGIAWTGDLGLGPGLLIGSCGQISWLRPGARQVDVWEEALTRGSLGELLEDLRGCITSIEPLDTREFVAALFRFSQPGYLYLVRLVEN